METKNIFIDTQAFLKQGLKFEGPVLKKIRSLGNTSLVNIYISEVVRREVSSKIFEKMEDVKKSFAKMAKDISILESNTPKKINDFSSDFKDIN